MSMREIDYEKIIKHIDATINALEYSGMRSGGKVKQAVLEINAMYEYKERIQKMLEADKPKPAPKPIPKPTMKGGE